VRPIGLLSGHAPDEIRRYVSGWETRSACRPGPEFLGVADGPDVLDPVVGDVEREHRHGDAVLLGDQAGLAVDRALQERQAGCDAGDIEGGAARDALAQAGNAECDRELSLNCAASVPVV
jgi:hypothetical protein